MLVFEYKRISESRSAAGYDAPLLYILASAAIANIRQLALFHVFPPAVAREWNAAVIPPAPANMNLGGFTSHGPLMGSATFDLRLPPHAAGLCVGMQE